MNLKNLVEEKNVKIGDKVKIVMPKVKLKEKRFNELIGYEGIVISFNEGTKNYPIPFYDYYKLKPNTRDFSRGIQAFSFSFSKRSKKR